MTGKRKKTVAKGKRVVRVQSALAAFELKPPKDHEHVSVRKVDNGYIVSHDGVKGGKPFNREFYTPKAPRLDVKRGARNGKNSQD